jgi:hypothetical protein
MTGCVQKRIHFGIHLQNVVITKMMLDEMGRDDHAENGGRFRTRLRNDTVKRDRRK